MKFPTRAVPYTLIVILLLALLVTACGAGEATETETEPTPPPEPTVDVAAAFVTYESEFTGLSVGHPADWAVEDFFLILLSNNEALLDAFGDEPPEDMAEDALVLLLADDLDAFDDQDPPAMLNEVMAEFVFSDSGPTIVEGPTALTVNGQEGAMAMANETTEDGLELTLLYAVVVNRSLERAAIFVGLTSPAAAETFLPTLRAMVNTIDMVEPVDFFADDAFMDDVEFDFDDPLYPGDVAEGTISDAAPVEFAYFALSNESVEVVVTPLDDNLAVAIDVIDEAGQSILPDGEAAGQPGAVETLDVLFPEFGNYTITVRGLDGSTGSFELAIRN